ncbi:MAG: tail fiber domain-containing protein [Bacteroidetes bacterium]|nr:tail fiber domain-containing protein [Bacteroidota bacterium]
MKNSYHTLKTGLTLLIALSLTASSLFAQAPQKMNYQSVVRNSSGVLISNANVGVRISILQNSASGSAVYVETQTQPTNTNGLITLEIGAGTVVSGSFSGINWETGTYYIKTQIDPTGGTNYSITGTSQLLSVPYALSSANSFWKKNGNDISFSGGNVGIGTTTPGQNLTVNGGMNVDGAGLNDGTLGQTAASAGLSFGLASGEGIASKRTSNGNLFGLDFYTAFVNRMSITNTGNVGIANSTPHALLQFDNSLANRKLVLYESVDNDNEFYGFGINPSTLRYQTSSPSSDHVFFAATGAGASNELMRIKGNGLVSIGNASAVSDLHIKQSGGSAANQQTGGINLENSGKHWRIYNSNDFIRFNYSTDGVSYTAKSYISSTDGSYNVVSDARLKRDFESFETVLPKVLALKPLKYHYLDNKENAIKTMGFLAQDVQKIFPEIVSHEEGEDLLAIDYSKFAIVSIKAIQEQQAQIEALKKQVADLSAAVQKLTK